MCCGIPAESPGDAPGLGGRGNRCCASAIVATSAPPISASAVSDLYLMNPPGIGTRDSRIPWLIGRDAAPSVNSGSHRAPERLVT